MEFLFRNMFLVITVLSLISSILLLIKFIGKREPTLFIGACMRLYVFISGLFLLDKVPQYPLFCLGLELILLSDVFNNINYFISRKYIKQMEQASLFTIMRHMMQKLSTVLNNPFIGFFTITEDGVVEFANEKAHEILHEVNLAGRNLYDYLDEDTIRAIKSNKSFNGIAKVKFVTPKGTNIKEIHITTSATVNGHRTFTGSLIE